MMEKDILLADDISYLESRLSEFGAYRFAEDVQARMEAQGLSAVSLGKRCFVSHTIIDRWRTGKAKPNGRERMKELGMALGMDRQELDAFLLRNGYPRLYVKNPLDSAARMLLQGRCGKPDVVEMYRELVERLGLSGISAGDGEPPLATAYMSSELKKAVEDGCVSRWFDQFRGQYAGDEKTQLPDLRLCRFLLLYMGEKNVHELAVEGELPKTLKNLLYPILAGKTVTIKYLREKLMAFGLYTNMTEEEIDIMLSFVKLQPITEPVSMLDMAVLSALRAAHERYPLYEAENLQQVMRRLDPPQDDYDAELLEQYRQRADVARRMVEYYEKHPLSEEEREFEEQYTSYGDRGVMDYVHDLLEALTERGSLPKEETDLMLKLLDRNTLI